jgi:hypothetical protein
VSLPPWEDLLVRQSSKDGRAGGAFRDIDGRVNDGSGAEFPRRTLRETVWKIAGGLVERGFWQYKTAK